MYIQDRICGFCRDFLIRIWILIDLKIPIRLFPDIFSYWIYLISPLMESEGSCIWILTLLCAVPLALLKRVNMGPIPEGVGEGGRLLETFLIFKVVIRKKTIM